MLTRFHQQLQRSLLFVIACAVIVAAPQPQADFQTALSFQATIPVKLAQTQTLQSAVVAVESVGVTVSDMDQAVAFYSNVLSFKKPEQRLVVCQKIAGLKILRKHPHKFPRFGLAVNDSFSLLAL